MFTPQAKKGGVSEWPKEHAWKACIRDKRIVGSNPTSSEFFCVLEILVFVYILVLIQRPRKFQNLRFNFLIDEGGLIRMDKVD